VYALVRAFPADEGLPSGATLTLLDCDGIEAAVGPVTSAPVADAAGLRAHDAVVRRLHETAPSVLPMRFGCVVRDEATLRAWVETVRPILEHGLDLVKDREQMVLRIYGDAAPASPDEPDHRDHHRGTRYLMKRSQASLPQELGRGMEALRLRLGDLVHGERLERHETPPLIATLRHLVPRDASEAYRGAVAGQIPGFEHVTLRVSGPWPPYAFTPEEIS
jgi:hypothetical protein